jgi:hypothetical protein
MSVSTPAPKIPMQEAKKLTGFKLKPGVSRKALNLLDLHNNISVIMDFSINSKAYQDAIDLGILDALFDKVYEPIIRPGDWVYIVDGGNGALGLNSRVGRLLHSDFKGVPESYELGATGITSAKGAPLIKFPNGQIGGLNPSRHEYRLATSEEVEKAMSKTFTMTLANDEKITIRVQTEDDSVHIQGTGVNISVPASHLSALMDLDDQVMKISIGGYRASIDQFKVGCKTFKRSDLQYVLSAHKEYNWFSSK